MLPLGVIEMMKIVVSLLPSASVVTTHTVSTFAPGKLLLVYVIHPLLSIVQEPYVDEPDVVISHDSAVVVPFTPFSNTGSHTVVVLSVGNVNLIVSNTVGITKPASCVLSNGVTAGLK